MENKLAVVLGIAGAAAGVYALRKVNKLCEKLDASYQRIQDMTDLELDKAQIEAAVNAKIDTDVEKLEDQIVDEVKNNLTTKVRNDCMNRITETARALADNACDEMAERIKDISEAELKERVVKMASSALEKDFGDIFSGYNNALNDLRKLTSKFAKKMSNNW